MMKQRLPGRAVLALMAMLWSASAWAAEAVENDGGKYYDAEGNPVYQIDEDGTVDWYTYSGFRRYHSECHVCHGPDGMGSSFAPGLAESLQKLSYEEFLDVVVNGRENIGASQQSKMPAFGVNLNVMCYLDDLYVYLRARSDEAVPRGRPPKKEPKSQEARDLENACVDG